MKGQQYDVIIVGAGPAGIFSALELVSAKSGLKILIIEKGRDIDRRDCPSKEKGINCINCSPCSILCGWGGAGAFSDGKITLSTEVGGILGNYDIHVNVVGGGRIDGPSAGVAIMSAILSAMEERPIRQDIAVTGEISIQGRVKAVGGIFEKIYGAKQAGMTKVLVPKENAKDVPTDISGIEVILVETAEQVIGQLFEPVLEQSAVC